MQPIENSDSNTQPPTGSQRFKFRFHTPLSYADPPPNLHLLMVSDSGTITRLALCYSSSRLLEFLIYRADLIVDRQEMFAFGWPDKVVGQNCLNQAMSNCSELLGDDELRSIIQTIPRRGCRYKPAFLSEDYDEFRNNKHTVQAALVMTDDRVDLVNFDKDKRPSLLILLPQLINYLLAARVVALLAVLFWRINWEPLVQRGIYSATETEGELDTNYLQENPEELLKLQLG